MFFGGLGVVAALVLTFGQAASQQFAGSWTMSLRGQTYARLELQTTNGTLSGRISLGSVHMDDQGNVDRVLAPATNYTRFSTSLETASFSSLVRTATTPIALSCV
jgi:hypothetical protein